MTKLRTLVGVVAAVLAVTAAAILVWPLRGNGVHGTVLTPHYAATFYAPLNADTTSPAVTVAHLRATAAAIGAAAVLLLLATATRAVSFVKKRSSTDDWVTIDVAPPLPSQRRFVCATG